MHEVHVRVAREGDTVYIDLADETWRAVEITAQGWRVVERPPVRFRRPVGLLPLPGPKLTGHSTVRPRGWRTREVEPVRIVVTRPTSGIARASDGVAASLQRGSAGAGCFGGWPARAAVTIPRSRAARIPFRSSNVSSAGGGRPRSTSAQGSKRTRLGARRQA